MAMLPGALLGPHWWSQSTNGSRSIKHCTRIHELLLNKEKKIKNEKKQ